MTEVTSAACCPASESQTDIRDHARVRLSAARWIGSTVLAAAAISWPASMNVGLPDCRRLAKLSAIRLEKSATRILA